jgi:hypothetical protein
MEKEIQPRRYLVLQLKFFSWSTDLDQSYRCCRPLGLSARYGVSGKSLEQKKRYN